MHVFKCKESKHIERIVNLYSYVRTIRSTDFGVRIRDAGHGNMLFHDVELSYTICC